MKLSFFFSAFVAAMPLLFATAPGSTPMATSFPQVPLSGVPTDGSGLPAPPIEPGTKPACENRGVVWSPPKVIGQGSVVCTGDFELQIGLPELGLGIMVKTDGCPSYLEILPGHYDPIHKPGFTLVLPPQKWPATKSYYKCETGFFGGKSCVPDAASPPEVTKKFARSYAEIPCPMTF